jgi:hypothetical protein
MGPGKVGVQGAWVEPPESDGGAIERSRSAWPIGITGDKAVLQPTRH